MTADQKLLTTGTLAIALPASDAQIRAALRGGIIEPIRAGRMSLFKASDVQRIREAMGRAGLYTPSTHTPQAG